MSEQLADRGPLLAGLGELRPVGSDPFLVVEPAARVCQGHGHGGHALRGREHEGHRVLLPWRASGAVPGAAPQVDDPLARVVDAAGRADLTALRKFSMKASRTGSQPGATMPWIKICPMPSWPPWSPRFRRRSSAGRGERHSRCPPWGSTSRRRIHRRTDTPVDRPLNPGVRLPATRHRCHSVGCTELARDRMEV